MLQRLLALLAHRGTRTQAELARELGVSGELLEQMLDDLTRAGYLSLASGDCTGLCSHCPLSDTCSVGSSGRVWTLTARGVRAARPNGQGVSKSK